MSDTTPGSPATDGSDGDPDRPDPVERFRDFPLFKGLDDEQIATFLAHGDWVELAAGEVFIEQREAGGSLFFVGQGDLEVFARDDNGGEHALAEIRAPAVVGELEFLTGEARAASVRSRTPGYAVALSSDRLLERLRAGDKVTSRVLFSVARVLARRLAAMNRKFVELDQRGPGARFDELRDFQARLMSEWTM